MKEEENKKVEPKEEDVVSQYNSQTEDGGDVHFEHVDWTYNDGSCCC